MSVGLCTKFGRHSALAVSSRQALALLSRRSKDVRCLATRPTPGMATPTPRHVLSPYERFVVRITRSYEGSEIPTTIGPEAMDRVNSRFRIGLMAIMMTLTLAVCLYAIQQGKNEKAAHSNQMVYARNRDRYK